MAGCITTALYLRSGYEGFQALEPLLALPKGMKPIHHLMWI